MAVLYVQLVVVDAVVSSPVFLKTGRDQLIRAGRDQLIRAYFREVFEYRAIVCFLYFIHGISLSLSQLKHI